MRRLTLRRTRLAVLPAALIAAPSFGASPLAAEPPAWTFSAEPFERRFGEDEDLLAWSADLTAGYDGLKLPIRSEAE